MQTTLFALILSIFSISSAHAEWKEYKTIKGCLVYEWSDDEHWNWINIDWTERCESGKPISGAGALTTLTGTTMSNSAFWRETTGTLESGVWQGSTSQRTEKDLRGYKIEYSGGCSSILSHSRCSSRQQSRKGQVHAKNQTIYPELNGIWRTVSSSVRKSGQIVSTRLGNCELEIDNSEMNFKCSNPTYASRHLLTPQGPGALLAHTTSHSTVPTAVGKSTYIEFSISQEELQYGAYPVSSRELKDSAEVVVTTIFRRTGTLDIATKSSQNAIAPQSFDRNSVSRKTEEQSSDQFQQADKSNNQQCRKDILAIHERAARDVQDARTTEGSKAAEYAQMREQKDLFTGRCSQYPDAAGFVATADRVLGDSNSSSGIGNVQSPAISQLSSQETNANPAVESQSDDRVVFTGPVTSNCIAYTATKRTSTGAQWFKFTNGCSVTVNVWYASLPSGVFGSLAKIKGGSSSESWFSTSGPHAVNAIKYHACREKEGMFDVYLNKKTMQCYYRR